MGQWVMGHKCDGSDGSWVTNVDPWSTLMPGFHPGDFFCAPRFSFELVHTCLSYLVVLRLWEHLSIFERLAKFPFKIPRLEARRTRQDETLVHSHLETVLKGSLFPPYLEICQQNNDNTYVHNTTLYKYNFLGPLIK